MGDRAGVIRAGVGLGWVIRAGVGLGWVVGLG